MTTNQPSPVEPAELTDQELLRTYNEELVQTYNARNYINEERVRAATIAGLRAVITADRARRAAPPAEGETEELAAMRRQVVPVPVSERLPNLSPQGGDFNDAGLLWWFIPKLGWRMCSRDAVDCIPYPTHWLPFHALPLPSREVGND